MYKPYEHNPEYVGPLELAERRLVKSLNDDLRVYKTHFEARKGVLPEGVENLWAEDRLARTKIEHPTIARRIAWAPRTVVDANGETAPNPDYGFLIW